MLDICYYDGVSEIRMFLLLITSGAACWSSFYIASLECSCPFLQCIVVAALGFGHRLMLYMDVQEPLY